MLSIIKERFYMLESLVRFSGDFIKYTSRLLEGYDPGLLNYMRSTHNKCHNLLENLKKMINEEGEFSIDYINNTYQIYDLFNKDLLIIYEYMADDELFRLTGTVMSNSDTEEIKAKRYASKKYFKKLAALNDDDIFNKVFAKIDKNDKNLLKYLNNINKFTIALAGHINAPQEFFQKLADEILESLNRNTNEKTLARMNMIPDKIIEEIKPNSIILDKPGTTVIYNIRGLIDEEYIKENDLVTNVKNGLNKKIIKKLNTIEKYDTFSLERAEQTDNKLTKIEPTENKLTKIEPTEIKLTKKEPAKINKNETIHIVDKINNNKYQEFKNIRNFEPFLNGNSNRPIKYNSIQYDTIKDNYFDNTSQRMLSDYSNFKQINISLDVLKDKIRDTIEEKVKKYIDDIQEKDNVFEKIYDKINIYFRNPDDILTKCLPFEYYSHLHSVDLYISYTLRMNKIISEFSKRSRVFINEHLLPVKILNDLDYKVAKQHIINSVITITVLTISDMEKNKIWEIDKTLKEYYLLHMLEDPNIELRPVRSVT